MRLIRMLCLAAIAAVAAMAFVGVSVASANTENIVLCAIGELKCKEENWLVTEVVKEKQVAQIHGTATNPTLVTSIATVECEKSLANITVVNELAESLSGEVTELSFSNCFLEGSESKCTVTVETLGGMTFTHGGKELEALAVADSGTTAHVVCPLINCYYTANEKTELIAHSEEGHLFLLAEKATLPRLKGFLCPAESKWNAKYKASGTMYIES